MLCIQPEQKLTRNCGCASDWVFHPLGFQLSMTQSVLTGWPPRWNQTGISDANYDEISCHILSYDCTSTVTYWRSHNEESLQLQQAIHHPEILTCQCEMADEQWWKSSYALSSSKVISLPISQTCPYLECECGWLGINLTPLLFLIWNLASSILNQPLWCSHN